MGGLPQSVRGPELREYFSKFGEIVTSVVMMDKSTGRSRGFGFVTFKEQVRF